MGIILRHKVAVGAVALILIFGAWYLFTDSPSTGTLTTAGGDTSTDNVLVKNLLALRAITLSSNLFSDPAFASLKDDSTPIVSEPAGRADPFAPLTQNAAATASTTRAAQLFKPAGRQ